MTVYDKGCVCFKVKVDNKLKNVIMKDALFVPILAASLISVGKLMSSWLI